MKILLVGEYSRLHNSLKEGLLALGHQVTLVGDGDLFKNYPMDVSLKPHFFEHNFLNKKTRTALYRLSGTDPAAYETAVRFTLNAKKFKGFDLVQLINSNALKTPLNIQKRQLSFLKAHNKKMVLCACGTDTPIVDYLLDNKMQHHILTPYLEGKYGKDEFKFEFDYITPAYKKYYKEVESLFDVILPSDMDYYLPLKEHPKVPFLIPTPINVDLLKPLQQLPAEKIHIFLGINALSQVKKGSVFFREAVQLIEKKYPEKVRITIATSLPYEEYIRKYDTAHILLDMVYAYDQGYNALEAMAKGKVVFTGAEKEFLQHYNLQEDEVCINGKPDVEYLVDKLSWLIENPSEIERIGKNARAFIEKEHHYIKVAEKFVEVYKS